MTNKVLKEYDELMKELYYKNQEMITKTSIVLSGLASALLLNIIFNENNGHAPISLKLALISFLLNIILEIVSGIIAAQGCDVSQQGEEDSIDKGERLFDWAKNLNFIANGIFILAIVLIIISVF